MAETMNMREVSLEKFLEQVRKELDSEFYEPMIGLGKAGIGKTYSITELAEELGIGYKELRLVTLTETDMLGIPYIDEYGGTNYASNALLPRVERDGEAGILVLDEITSASSAVRTAALQLLDSKRSLGNYKLPPKWKIIALGNGVDDGGFFNGMNHAFLNRGLAYRIEPNFNYWKVWAIKNGVNSSILAFLTFDPSLIHSFNPDEVEVFPSPRSWTELSKRLNKREERVGGMLDIDEVELYAAGFVGDRVAPQFSAFYAYNSKIISPEDIIYGKCNNLDVASLDTQVVYLAIQALVKQLKKEISGKASITGETDNETLQKVVNACNWGVLIGEQRLDYAITLFNDMANIKEFVDIVNTENFDTACPKFSDFAIDNSIVFGK